MTMFYAALLGGIAVLFGAFGAHTLKTLISPEMLVTFETGVRYQMYHSLALLALGATKFHSRGILLLFIGTLVFSGSLYAISLTGIKALGAITPIGGVLLLAGWAWIALDARKLKL